ncbi:11016_t:CDS:1, partial [Cetraspora pellucida]
EKKLQDQKVSSKKQNTFLEELEKLMPLLLLCDMKTVNIVHNQEKTVPKESIQNIFQKSIENLAKASIYVLSKVIQGLLQEF